MGDLPSPGDSYSVSLLSQAAIYDNIELLTCLLEGDERNNVNKHDHVGQTALYTALVHSSYACFAKLLEHGADPTLLCNISSLGKQTTVVHCVLTLDEVSREKFLCLLRRFEIDMSVVDSQNLTPLDLARSLGLNEEADAFEEIHGRWLQKKVRQLHEEIQAACSRAQLDHVTSVLATLTKETASEVANFAMEGANTLLYRCSQDGKVDLVNALISFGADARAHPWTGQTPLHVACYNHHTDVLNTLLQRFPHLINAPMSEHMWCMLPLHIAAQESPEVLSTLLDFSYPQHMMTEQQTTLANGSTREYSAAFDVNAKDTNDRTALYYACISKRQDCVELLLKHKVTERPILLEKSDTDSGSISGEEFCPLNTAIAAVDGLAPLHCAVLGQSYKIVEQLLESGADVNIPLMHGPTPSTALEEACGNGDCEMVNLLYRFGATDSGKRMLQAATNARNEGIISTLLKFCSSKDPDNTINKRSMFEYRKFDCGLPVKLLRGSGNPLSRSVSTFGVGSYEMRYPRLAVIVNWHQCFLDAIKEPWLAEAVYYHNSSFPRKPEGIPLSLYALTRIDVSGNRLSNLPACIFGLKSLKVLNVAHNQIADMSTDCRSFWKCPVLEQVDFSYNHLTEASVSLFQLPMLFKLDLSRNRLETLPNEMWTSPALQSLNLSHNKLAELPTPVTATSVKDSPELLRRGRTSSRNELSSVHKDLSGLGFFGEDADEVDVDSVNIVHLEHEVRPVSLWSEKCTLTTEFLPESKAIEGSPLRDLDLSNNSLTSLPIGLCCLCPNLSRLTLKNNRLSKFEPVSAYPVNLKILDLSGNCMTSMYDATQPELHAVCFSMTHADSESKNQSTSSLHACQHSSHLALHDLSDLNLSNNMLDALFFQVEPSRHGIKFSNKERASSISSDASASSLLLFPNLAHFDASCNEISWIPASISCHVNLCQLNMANNKLTVVPHEIGLLQRLWNVDFTGNRLEEPLATMVSNSSYRTSDIVGYLRSVLEQSKPYRYLKLMLVGVHDIGKTSLLRLLSKEGKVTRKAKHWVQRVHETPGPQMESLGGKVKALSTNGVDIGEVTFDRWEHGKVTFRTWDFGGQKEYYATHQYFLSKRSLYLVVWKLTDENGLHHVHQWLLNIQAVACNSPVIIVGTHLDALKKMPSTFPSVAQLREEIQRRFIQVSEPDKHGLPHVIRQMEVSCETGENVKSLAKLIYDVAFQLHVGGTKQLLLKQQVPASYINLEEAISLLVSDLRTQGKDPILKSFQYRDLVMQKMAILQKPPFRDLDELSQATKFLHENGVLLHFQDPSLSDLYFLDPQWLCDILASVVTVPQISVARSGVIKTGDLQFVFKNTSIRPEDVEMFMKGLLNRFELGITYDDNHILIPSLLPPERNALKNKGGVMVPITKTQCGTSIEAEKSSKSKRTAMDLSELSRVFSEFGSASLDSFKQYAENGEESGICETSLMTPQARETPETTSDVGASLKTESPRNTDNLCRLYILTYFPAGFWSRVITSLLADSDLPDLLLAAYTTPEEDSGLFGSLIHAEHSLKWNCWQTGLDLRLHGNVVLSVKEILPNTCSGVVDYRNTKLLIHHDSEWCSVEHSSMSVMEIKVPTDNLSVSMESGDTLFDSSSPPSADSAHTLQCNRSGAAGVLVNVVNHVDNLLEEWYPDIGTRYIQTSEGRYLVTRLVPCNHCLIDAAASSNMLPEPFSMVSDDGVFLNESGEFGSELKPLSGGADSLPKAVVFLHMVEQCILVMQTEEILKCPRHGVLDIGQVAPDLIFADLNDTLLFSKKQMSTGRYIGRGAFGFVFEGHLLPNGGEKRSKSVAAKALQPICPGKEVGESIQREYEHDKRRWLKDQTRQCCNAYLTLRQEISLLSVLDHPHIVSMIGICLSPLCLLLEYAPLGSLRQILDSYHRNGWQVSLRAVGGIIKQTVAALGYLHDKQIIYRDLKSDNALVWSLPNPLTSSNKPVKVKLSDYGISCRAMPGGAKGHQGTPGFMAPEIIQHRGEEIYTSKIDIYSFGIFLYELTSCRQPYEEIDAINQRNFILNGGRPSLSRKQLQYPSNVLDLMTLCWSNFPNERPSCAAITSLISTPAFACLLQVLPIVTHAQAEVTSALITTLDALEDPELGSELQCDADGSVLNELWLSVYPKVSGLNTECRMEVVKLNSTQNALVCTLAQLPDRVSCMTAVNDTVWMAEDKLVHVYNARDYHRLFSFELTCSRPGSTCSRLYHIPSSQTVLAVMSTGMILICSATTADACEHMSTADLQQIEEGIREIRGEGLPVYSLLSIHSSKQCNCRGRRTTHMKEELWFGHKNAQITVLELKQGHGSSSHPPSRKLYHYQPTDESQVTYFMTVSQKLTDSVWSYVYPGSSLFRWTVSKKSIAATCDCSTMVPRELAVSGQFPGNDGRLEPSFCQITALQVPYGLVYAGTSWGCILVLEAFRLELLTAVRAHCDAVTQLLPAGDFSSCSLTVKDNSLSSEHKSGGLDASTGAGKLKKHDKTKAGSEGSETPFSSNQEPVMVSVAKGYIASLDALIPQDSTSIDRLSDSLGIYALKWRFDVNCLDACQ